MPSTIYAASRNVIRHTFLRAPTWHAPGMGATERRLWYIQRLNLFAGLSHHEIESMAGRLHDQVWQRRQMILEPDSRGDRIYLVKTGAVRVYQISPEGRELTTAILRPGKLLGTAALAGVSQQAAFAEALEPQTCVCDATAEEFLRMMSAHPMVAAKVMVGLARHALRLEQQLEQLAFQEVPVRLAQALVQFAADNSGELPSNLTHESLAKLISSTRETVSKTLGQFADEGLVELGYRRIRVLNWPRLRQMAGLEDSEPKD